MGGVDPGGPKKIWSGTGGVYSVDLRLYLTGFFLRLYLTN